MESSSLPELDYLFKCLLIGDSGVGKSTLLQSFTSNSFEDLSPTIGADFKVKHVTIGGKKLKLAIWDRAGRERFGTLTSSYYRGAQGIIMVYDVTRRETFTNLSDIWAKEIDLYATSQDCIKMLVGNKVDNESERVVSKKEGLDFAREYGCFFLECSAKTRQNVDQCFKVLVLERYWLNRFQIAEDSPEEDSQVAEEGLKEDIQLTEKYKNDYVFYESAERIDLNRDDYAFDICTGLFWPKLDIVYFDTVAKSEGFDSFSDPSSTICGAIRPYRIDELHKTQLAVIDLAMQEHNEKMQKVNNSEDILKFKKIVKVNYQVVRGANLYYTLELTNARGACRFYELKAWVWDEDEYEIYFFRPAVHYPSPSASPSTV